MTFFEAALHVLEREGRPLHFLEITEKSVEQNLLSHVGKIPEQTMLARLSAMARRMRDRRIIVTAKDTFGLIEWSIQEDVDALAQTGLPPENPEAELPPLRSHERHPAPRTSIVRTVGRGERERRKRREEEEGRGRRRRYPPLPEVAFEVLSDHEGEEGLDGEAIARRAQERELASANLGAEQVLTALLEDNQRRIDAGRRPQFLFDPRFGKVSLERAGKPSEAPPLELQAAFATALGIPLQDGRPVLERGSRKDTSALDEGYRGALDTARGAVRDARRALARSLRARLGELEPSLFERAMFRLLLSSGFRDVKVAKRGRSGSLLSARKREGSLELRYAIRLGPGRPTIDRAAVKDLRKDIEGVSAQVGLLLSAGEVRGEARSEATSSGSLALLWCGDALGEKLLDAGEGVRPVQTILYKLDERFFDDLARETDDGKRRREPRQKDRKPAREARGSEKGERSRSGRRQGSERGSDVELDEGAEADPLAATDWGGAAEQPDRLPGRRDDDEALAEAEAFVSGRGDGDAEASEAGAGAEELDDEGRPRRKRRRRRRGRRSKGGQGEARDEGNGSGAEAGAEDPGQRSASDTAGSSGRDEGSRSARPDDESGEDAPAKDEPTGSDEPRRARGTRARRPARDDEARSEAPREDRADRAGGDPEAGAEERASAKRDTASDEASPDERSEDGTADASSEGEDEGGARRTRARRPRRRGRRGGSSSGDADVSSAGDADVPSSGAAEASSASGAADAAPVGEGPDRAPRGRAEAGARAEERSAPAERRAEPALERHSSEVEDRD